jgi:ankyrin repeat protein
MIAADKGHVSVVQLLLQRQDVDPNLKDVVGWTPVMKVAYNGHQPVVQLLQDVVRNSKSVNSSLIAPEKRLVSSLCLSLYVFALRLLRREDSTNIAKLCGIVYERDP